MIHISAGDDTMRGGDNPTIWTRAMMERLTVLWDEGVAAKAIARIMSGEYSVSLSKNAIIGRARRLMLKPRLSPANIGAAKANHERALGRAIGVTRAARSALPPAAGSTGSAPAASLRCSARSRR